MSWKRQLGIVSTAIVALAGRTPASAVAGDTTEADLLSTVDRAVDEGRFHDAEEMLRAAIDETDATVTDAEAQALEIIRRTRLDYSLSPEQMLEKLVDAIPSANPDDLERWTRQGEIQHRLIDGEIRYFRREPANILRFCEEAKRRRHPTVEPAGWDFDLANHLSWLIKQADAGSGSEVWPVRHRVTYRLEVHEGHPRLKQGARVRCWLPFPQEYRQQKSVRLVSASPEPYLVAANGQPHRTICFAQAIDDASKAPQFAAEFEFVTSAYCPKLEPSKARPCDVESALFREFTAERPPHIVFSPEVRRIVEHVVGDEPNPLLRAGTVFRWVCENVRYCSEMEYSTIRSLSAKALSTGRGDCGVQSMAFITLCRAAGVPARWQSGWETLPNGCNMHDWAEFYVEPWGWLPADPSYGLKEHGDLRVREFYCGHMDPYRLIVNLDFARPLDPPEAGFRSEPNDFQRGEIEIDGHNLYFDEWDWSFAVRTMPMHTGIAALGEAMDAVLPDLIEQGEIPGAVIAVGRKTDQGFETWQKAYGYLQIEPHRVPMPSDAVFDLASLTKPIAVGTCMMLLVQRGEVRLDEPVGTYLPEFREGDRSAVTVRHLMTHTSGEKPYLTVAERESLKLDAGDPCAGALRKYVRGLELERPAGGSVVYGCLNAILCAEIVETVTEVPLDRFAAENVFVPLKMIDTGFNPPASLRPRIVPTVKAARGRGEGGFLQGEVHDPLAAMQAGVSGNAGLFATAADLSRYAQMLLNGGELDGVRMFERQAVESMTSVQDPGSRDPDGKPDRRGLLWDVYPPDPGDEGIDALYAYGHTGYTGTAIRIYPEAGVYIVAVTNRVHPDDSGKVDAFRREVSKTVVEALCAVDRRGAKSAGAGD